MSLASYATLNLYILLSNIAAFACISYAFNTRPTYLSAAVFLCGGFNYLVINNWVIMVVVSISKLVRHILFGELRIIETEHIYEKMPFTLTKSLFDLAMFKVGNFLYSGGCTSIVIMLKMYHWILFDRFDQLIQIESEGTYRALKGIILNRTILVSFVILLFDFAFIPLCLYLSGGLYLNLYFIYEFEIGLLALDIVFKLVLVGINAAEILHLVRHPDEEYMESKGFLVQISELFHCFLKLLINFVLLCFIVNPSHFPVHIMHSCYQSSLDFYNKLRTVLNFIKNAKKLDKYLDNATQEDLNKADDLCIICRDDMTTEDIPLGHRSYPKMLKCSHIIHLGCLKSWLEISQVCPMCRAPVFDDFDADTDYSAENAPAENAPADNAPADNFAPLRNELNEPNEIPDEASDEEVDLLGDNLAQYFEPVNTRLQEESDRVVNVPDGFRPPEDWELFQIYSTDMENKYTVNLSGDVYAILEVIENDSGFEGVHESRQEPIALH